MIGLTGNHERSRESGLVLYRQRQSASCYLLLTKEAFPCAIGYAIILSFVRISGVPAE